MASTNRNRSATVIIIPERTEQASADNPNGSQPRLRKPHLLTVLLSLLALITLFHFLAVMHGAIPTAVPINCMGLLRTTDYGRVVHLQAQSQKIGAVQFTNQLLGGQSAVLIEVINTGTGQTVDAYIYGCAMRKQTPTLIPLFTQRGLIEGSISISASNTLITSELDTTISSQTLAQLQPLQQNVYHEYRWQYGHFVPITFPGLYPVSSRGEAEALQQEANNGQAQPWSDPLVTAEQMAKDIFKWPASSPQDNILSNNGTIARVQLVQESMQMRVTVTLERLIQRNKAGLWFVTGAQTNGMSKEQPAAASIITSPTTIKGAGALPDGQTIAALFDHTLTPLSLLNNPTLNVTNHGSYTGMLFYKNSVQKQPGLLLIQSLPPIGSAEAGQLLLTRVILN
ncbi:MAG TPA: hypothetical protein VEU97_03640 [Ktedonobacteraceae bacterium]|nr:hypothetical protein [Ktedonobacteraceae bacterium]